MADLLDIAPSTACEVVRIRGERIVVHGLRNPAAASIVARSPNLVGLLFGGLSVADITPRFIEEFGVATGQIIAAGCGHSGDEKYEQFAETGLLLEEQLQLVSAIIGLTFPNGFGSFAAMLTKIMGVGEGAKPIKVRLKKSPLPSQPSFDVDSHQIM